MLWQYSVVTAFDCQVAPTDLTGRYAFTDERLLQGFVSLRDAAHPMMVQSGNLSAINVTWIFGS